MAKRRTKTVFFNHFSLPSEVPAFLSEVVCRHPCVLRHNLKHDETMITQTRIIILTTTVNDFLQGLSIHFHASMHLSKFAVSEIGSLRVMRFDFDLFQANWTDDNCFTTHITSCMTTLKHNTLFVVNTNLAF